jgi:hypothetical protein
MNKKIIATVISVVMLASIAPTFALTVDGSLTVPAGAYVPPNAGSPPIIKAKWEWYDTADPLHTTFGTQILPPLDWNEKVTVEYWTVITDINGKDDVKEGWIDVYHPDGTFKYQFQLTEVDTSTPAARQAAVDKIQQAYDENLLHINSPYTLKEVEDEVLENSAKVYMGTADLDYHQMCGIYTVKAYAFDQANNIAPFFTNNFEYVCMAGIELDFNSINFGEVVQSSFKWVEGDPDFVWQTDGPACNPAEPGMPITCRKPTIKNIGNTPVYIDVTFDDMGFGSSTTGGWNVQFDSSLKHDAEVVFDPYVTTRLPDAGVIPEPYCEKNNAVLDLCNTEKISFSIHVKKAIIKEHTYSGEVTIDPVPLTYPWWPGQPVKTCTSDANCTTGAKCLSGYCCGAPS